MLRHGHLAYKYVDEVIVNNTEQDVLKILKSVEWDIRILGDEYRDREFTGREETINRCYFNRRPHKLSSSELRLRVVNNL